MVNVAINGFGRIGRMVLRSGWKDKKVNFIAVNDLTDTKTLAHLLQYDTVHGIFEEKVSYDQENIIIGSKKMRVFAEKEPTKLPWKKLKVDVVVESTGRFTAPYDAEQHLKAGAKKVLVSAPYKCENNICPANTFTIVMGVNEKKYNPHKHQVISNASCTTNCVAPIFKVVEDHIGVKKCFFSTIHAYTADQNIVDGPHKDLRRARAAALNIVPTSSGADIATTEAIPELAGKIKGSAFRVPVADGSVTIFTIETSKDVTPENVNALFKKEAAGHFKGIIEYSERELVSSDIIHNPYSSIFDSLLTKVVDKRMLELVAWYDNEWGYSCRVIDTIKYIVK